MPRSANKASRKPVRKAEPVHMPELIGRAVFLAGLELVLARVLRIPVNASDNIEGGCVYHAILARTDERGITTRFAWPLENLEIENLEIEEQQPELAA